VLSIVLFVLCPLYAVANGATALLLVTVAALTPQLLRIARASVAFVRVGGGGLDAQPDRLERVLDIVQRFRSTSEETG
jgi:hypothetical protein